MHARHCLLLSAWLAAAVPLAAQAHYTRTGHLTDRPGSPDPGFALMGGGTDLDSAFQWLCHRAGGGDFLVLRASGTPAYNLYIQKLCPQLNSVATLIITSRAEARAPSVAARIREASALFISGGDQSHYAGAAPLALWATPARRAAKFA